MISMAYVEIINPCGDEVKRFHDVLVEAFPDPYEREDVEILRANLREGSWTKGDEICRYHLIVALEDKQVVGGTSFYFYSDGCDALGMGSYLAVKTEFRNRGIGTKLIDVRDEMLSRDAGKLNCRLKGLVIQVNDPELMSAGEIQQDVMDSWERERFWRRLGYRKIAFNFIQPPIRKGEPPVEFLSLYMFPHCPAWGRMERMSRADLRDIIDCFIKCTGTPGSPETDPSYLQMKSELATQEHFRVLSGNKRSRKENIK